MHVILSCLSTFLVHSQLQVTKSFVIFLCLYIFFIIAFGIGFYVSLNTSVIPTPSNTTEKASEEVNQPNDNNPHGDCQNRTTQLILEKIEGMKEENFNFFKDGWRALIKTTTMFSGEFVS